MPNRLSQESSPYLLQHKDNPIDWWPWSEDVWERAVREDKPVFLSVGYSSCHWCHVMAHESFEDIEVATALNRDFICIKLDREERPDVDEVYMTAVQISSGHGGWPMSLFLTPDKKPFFAGTYFPREARGEHPGFLTIVGSLSKAWREQRADVQKSADEFGSALSAAIERTLPTDLQRLDVSILDQAVEILHQDFDDENGGFGDRPKFPPHAGLRFLLDYAVMRPEMSGDFGDLPNRAGHMALFTLEKMALGGIHDHVGGGFHRYSTDDRWLLPHFEKMLYDNAQLIGAYSHGAKVATEPRLRDLFLRTAKRATEWVEREMVSPEGSFFSALDADSDGREGAYYVWTIEELNLAGASQAFKSEYQVRVVGNVQDESTGKLTGDNVLHLVADVAGAFDVELGCLLEFRGNRTGPSLDNKALASWNGLMMASLAEQGSNDLALACAELWTNRPCTEIPHMITAGTASGQAFLDDLAFLADGLLGLFETTGDIRLREFASQLADRAYEGHLDADGGFFYVSNENERLFGRSKPFLDNATPSPNGVMARVLRKLGRQSDAIEVIRSGLGWVQRVPRATETLLREILWILWEAEDRVEDLTIDRIVDAHAFEISLAPQEIHLDDDGWGYSEIIIKLPPEVHINSNEPLAKWLSPTTVRIDGVLGEASFPESKEGVFRGETRIPLRLKPKSGICEFELTVRYQACTESECQLPQELSLTGMLIVP